LNASQRSAQTVIMSVSQSLHNTVSLKNGQKNLHKMNHSVHQQAVKQQHFVHDDKHCNKSKINANETTHSLDDDEGDEPKQLKPNTETKENDKAANADTLEYWQILKKSVIEGERVKLVPYCEHHVKTYNNWLNDPYIQQMTNSEPYSLEQEYEFQKEWNESDTKYIFIILDKTRNTEEPPMAGDINIFIQDEYCGELNVMIAEQQSRRKGLASETLSLVIEWAKTNLEIKRFIAKIQHDNASSIALFQKLGFQQTDYVDAFKEYTFSLTFENEHNQQYAQQIEEDEQDDSEGDECSERQTSPAQQSCHSQASKDGHCNLDTKHHALGIEQNVLHLQSDSQCTD